MEKKITARLPIAILTVHLFAGLPPSKAAARQARGLVSDRRGDEGKMIENHPRAALGKSNSDRVWCQRVESNH